MDLLDSNKELDQPTRGSVSPLTITRIETIPVRAKLGADFKGSHYHMTHRSTLITRVYTSDGIVGEAYAGDEDATLSEIDAIVHHELAPVIVGLDAMATELCWHAGYPVTFDILRDRRQGLVALAGVDAAIWDAVGKALGQPLWRLWGGFRRSIPLIAIGGYYGDVLGTIEQEIQSYVDLGLAGIKFKVGGASPEVDAERVERARAAAPEGFRIAIDANQGYSVAASARAGAADRASRHHVVRGTRGMERRRSRHARRAHARIHSGVRRSKRALTHGLSESDGSGSDRLLQLRRVVVGRPHGLAPHGRRRGNVQRDRRPPRGTSSVLAPRG